MATRYAIETIFHLTDAATPALGKIQSLGALTGVGLSKMADRGKEKWEGMKSTVAGVGLAVATAATGMAVAIGAGIVESTKKYIDFENVLVATGSKFADLDVTADDYQEHLNALSASAQQVGAVTKFSASDAMSALDKMAMAGISSAGAMNMLMGTTNLATAAGLDLSSAVDMATDAMGAFQLSTEADVVAENMNRVADVVAKATNMANFDMSMWFESVKMGAPTFTSLGGTIEEFTSIAGTLANAGLKGGQAGNEIKNMMLNLSAPAKSGMIALEELGISVFDAQGQMRSFTDILGQFEVSLDGMSDEKKSGLLKDIFGKEQIGAFNVLLASGTKNLSNFTGELQKAHELGLAETIAKAQSQSLQGQIASLQSAFEAKQLQIGEALSKHGGFDFLQGIVERLQNLDLTPFIGVISAAFEKVGQIVTTVFDGIAMKTGEINFDDIIKSINDIDVIGVASSIINVISNIGSLLSKLWELKDFILGLFIAVKVFDVICIGIHAVTVAQGILNAVMAASPIVLITMAIVALIALIAFGIYELVKHWDTVKAFLINIGEKIKWLGSVIVDAFVWLGGKISEFFSWALDKVLGFFNWIWEKITGLGSIIGDFFSGIWATITDWIGIVIDKIGGFFSWIWEKMTWLDSVIGDFFIRIWDSLVEWNTMIVEKILGFFNWIWEKITGLGSIIGDFFSGIWATITDWIGIVVDKIGGFFSWIWEKITNIASSIGGVFSSIWGGVSGFFTGMIDGVKNVGKNILSFLITPVIQALDLMSNIPGIGDWIGGKRDALIEFQNSLISNNTENTPQTDKSVNYISPTNAQSVMATRSENVSNAYMTIGLEKGLTGEVSGEAPNITVQNNHSGGFKNAS